MGVKRRTALMAARLNSQRPTESHRTWRFSTYRGVVGEARPELHAIVSVASKIKWLNKVIEHSMEASTQRLNVETVGCETAWMGNRDRMFALARSLGT